MLQQLGKVTRTKTYDQMLCTRQAYHAQNPIIPVAKASLVPRPSPSSTRACSVVLIMRRWFFGGNTYGACARGGGRRPGYEASKSIARSPRCALDLRAAR